MAGSKVPIEFHEEADRDVTEAVQWYAAHDVKVADAFIDALEHAVQRIAEAPSRWPTHRHGTRRYVMRQFPYQVIYREYLTGVQILAVAHSARRPDYWKGR